MLIVCEAELLLLLLKVIFLSFLLLWHRVEMCKLDNINNNKNDGEIMRAMTLSKPIRVATVNKKYKALYYSSNHNWNKLYTKKRSLNYIFSLYILSFSFSRFFLHIVLMINDLNIFVTQCRGSVVFSRAIIFKIFIFSLYSGFICLLLLWLLSTSDNVKGSRRPSDILTSERYVYTTYNNCCCCFYNNNQQQYK